MFSWIRQKFGPVVVAGIVGAIALVFVITDFISPRAGRGLGRSGGEVGAVNGEVITQVEFSREYARRIESLKQMTGGKLTDEQLKMFRIRENVFNGLLQRKLVLHDCRKAGWVPSDLEVKAKVQELPYFQKNGKFDLATYRALLGANRLDPGKFEDMVREDLMMQRWQEQLRAKVQVSEDEVQREFRLLNEKRNLKYVALDLENGRKGVVIPEKEIQEFLKNPNLLAQAKARYEQKRATDFKDKSFEAVQSQVARDILASTRVDEARKVNLALADQIVPLLGRGSDAAVQARLKSVGAQVRTSGLISADAPELPGAGDSRQVLVDAFSGKLEKAKKFDSPAVIVVAVVTESKKPDLSKFAGESPKLESQIRMRKERELEEEWLQELRVKARIKVNAELVNGPETEVSAS
ncbi:MAG: hypothetical protein RJB38_1199 [Pseudomonadota bacterium]